MTEKTHVLPARVGQTPQDYKRLSLERERMRPWEDGAHNDGSPGTFEWWYIDAEVAGSTLAIFMKTKPWVSHDLPLTPEVTVSLKSPDGSTTEKTEAIQQANFLLRRTNATCVWAPTTSGEILILIRCMSR